MKTKLTAEQERNQIKNAYSYVRLSTKRQTHGDKSGIDRQAENFKTVCEQYEWIPQTQTFSDLGVSGYSGANFKGDLGRFMDLAKQGKLAPYPVLVLESLDRFSRQDIDESEPAVMDLLKAGVAIHIKFSGQTFTRASTVELGDRIVIMVALKAAYNYSQQLSERVTAAKDRKLERLEKGESVNVRDYAPRWISWNKDSKTHILNDRAEAVRVIFKQYQAGQSLTSICRTLNNEETGIKSFLGGQWTKQTVRKILSNPATYGDFRGKAIFPAVITKEQFNDVQDILSRNAGVKLKKGEKAPEGAEFGRRGRKSKYVNIFRGLVRCCECGHSMSMNTSRSHPYYRCDSHIHGACDNGFSVRVSMIEENLICGLLQCSPEELLAAHDKSLAHQISQLNLKRNAVTKKIEALLELAGIVGVEEIKAKVTPLKTERDTLDAEISKLQLQSRAASSSPESLSVIKSLFTSPEGHIEDNIDKALEVVRTQLANPETRTNLVAIMPQVVKTIEIKGNEAFTVNYVAGGSETDQII